MIEKKTIRFSLDPGLSESGVPYRARFGDLGRFQYISKVVLEGIGVCWDGSVEGMEMDLLTVLENNADFNDIEEGLKNVLQSYEEDCGGTWKVEVQFTPQTTSTTLVDGPVYEASYLYSTEEDEESLQEEEKSEDNGESSLCALKLHGSEETLRGVIEFLELLSNCSVRVS